jgi:ribonucleoside-diphosphate reductase alpha chain
MTFETPSDLPEISLKIWDSKYRLKNFDGTPIDKTPNDTWLRVARALASCESDPETWTGRFYEVMSEGLFSPAGRIIAGAGTERRVTLSNCLSGETLILTAEYGLVAIGEIAGENVHVLDGNGKWVFAPINVFGEQPVAPVTLKGGYNSRERKTIYATAGHRWILEGGDEVTTEYLKGGHVLKTVKRRDVEHSPAYLAGVRHGIVYGDWTITRPDCFEGDLAVYRSRVTERDMDLKSLPPAGISVEYLTGFLRGWMAANGCAGRGKDFISCGANEADWLKRYGPVAGMEVSRVTKSGDETNYERRNKAVFNVHFHRWTMIAEDFLLETHREKFETTTYPWIVESVGPMGDPVPVYCPRVTTTDSVQLDLGIHTGQCFTMGTIPDSMDGIFSHLREAALTMQQGGGIGYDFSTIRPKGSLVKGVAADASGPLSFMDCWDAMCRTVMSAGSRRGAMMATMRCDHPDIIDFIEAKADPARLRMFNLSVLVTDEFMGAVEAGHNWRLHFEDRHGNTLVERVVDARELWNKIMRSTYDYAEPGVIFIDRVNEDHNLGYLETIATTNPCGEKPMGPYASCLLGSINLARMVENPFVEEADIKLNRLKETVETAIRMMDNVIEVGNFPLKDQEWKAREDRQLGLGVTGLADALAMFGITYGTPKAAAWTEKVMRAICLAAYEASVSLAQEKGAFPSFDADEFLKETRFAGRMLPGPLKQKIRKHGIRNGLLISIAPTGTISLFAGNVSSGIEPIFALSYDRKVLQPDGSKTTERVVDYAVAEFERMFPGKPLPPQFVTAQNLTPEAHVVMQAAAQKWVDSSISKTVNVPKDISFEDFKEVYALAYRMGCKGCTTYRPNDITGSVLSVAEAPEEAPKESAETVSPSPEVPTESNLLPERPVKVTGATYKIKWPTSPHALYVTINDIEEDGSRRPYEIFLNSKNLDHHAWTVALTRMISAIFRRPHDSRFVAEELQAVFDPQGGAWLDGSYVPSIPASIGRVIAQHMESIGYGTPVVASPVDTDKAQVAALGASGVLSSRRLGPACPACGSFDVKNESGCMTCLSCGYSKCG